MNGIPAAVMIDTGAVISCIDFDFVTRLALWPWVAQPVAGINLTGITDNPVQSYGTITLAIQFPTSPQFKEMWTFYILKNLGQTAILGNDFLQRHKLSIMYEGASCLKNDGLNLRVPIHPQNNQPQNTINVLYGRKFNISGIGIKISQNTSQTTLQCNTLSVNHVTALANASRLPVDVSQPPPKIIDIQYVDSNAINPIHALTTSDKNMEDGPINDHIYSCQEKVDNLSELKNTRTFVVPSTSEQVLFIKVSEDVFDKWKGKLALILPLEQALNGCVLLSKAVVKFQSKSIPIRIMNLSNQPQTLEKGQIIGTIIHCEESEVQEVDWKNEILTTEHSTNVNTVSARSEEQLQCIEDQLLKEHPWLSDLNWGALKLPQRVTVFKELIELGVCFSQGPYDIGRTEVMQAKIELTTDKPVFKRQYPMAPAKMTELQQEVQKLKDLKVVEPSHSDFNSPVILVNKADGSRRLCVDFRALNKFVKVYTHPLPTFLECSQLLTNNAYYSSLDLFGGYHQMSLHPDSRKYTTFTVGHERLAFNVLPFGITSGSALFQQLMNVLLGDLQYKQLITYIDDVLIFAQSFEEHLERLVMVLKRLKQANLKLKTKKCHLFTKKVAFLGHTITDTGIYPSQEKIAAVKNWPSPTNRKQCRQFLGLASFFRRFIPSFANIANPLHSLTSVNVKFKWGPEEESAFVQLKNCLINPPVLANPRFDRDFTVYTDASYAGLGGILTQMDDDEGEYAIAYTSRKLKDAETRFSVYEIEMLAIIHAVQEFRCYIHGSRFTLVTDACPLTNLLSQKHPTARNWRWILKLQQYNFTLRHRKGSAHGSVDALSRRPDYVEKRQAFKNPTVNLMERVEVCPKQLREWKNDVAAKIGVTLVAEHPSTIIYQSHHSDSLFELLSNIFTHTVQYAHVFRELIANFEAQNRRFVELARLSDPDSDISHIKQLRKGAPADLLEVQSACSLFHIPILYRTPEGIRFMLGEVPSKLFPYAPNGTILEIEKDKFANWTWTNPSLTPSAPDPGEGLAKRDKKEKVNFDKALKNVDDNICVDSPSTINTPVNCQLCALNITDEKPLYVPSTQELIACQKQDGYCQEWLTYLKDGSRPYVPKRDFEKLKDNVKISREGVLIYSHNSQLRPGEPDQEIVLLPLSLFKYALESIHDFLGHLGRDKTLHLVKQRYHRPSLTVLVARYLQTCRFCKNKSGIDPIKLLPVQQYPIAQQRFQIWSVDILGPFRVSSSGNKYILSCLDHYTRWLECIALPNYQSVTVAKAMVSLIVARWGVPVALHSDRGPNFISDIIKTFYEVLKIKKTHTLPYRPQGNGKCEISNKFIVNAIKSRTCNDQSDWDEQLDYALLAYRSSIHRFLADTPFYCALGFDPLLPTDLLLDRQVHGGYALGMDPTSLGAEVALRLQVARQRYKEAAQKEIRSQHKYANRNRDKSNLKPGDVVLLKKPLTRKGYSKKLHKKYIKAFRIIKQASEVTFVVQEMNGRKQYLVHGENLVYNDEAFRDDCDAWYDEAQHIMDDIKAATIEDVTPPAMLPPTAVAPNGEEDDLLLQPYDEDPVDNLSTLPNPPTLIDDSLVGAVGPDPHAGIANGVLPPPLDFHDNPEPYYIIGGERVPEADLVLPPPPTNHGSRNRRLRSGKEYTPICPINTWRGYD